MKTEYNKIEISFEAAVSLILMAGVPILVKFTSANPYTIGVFRLTVGACLIYIVLKPIRYRKQLNFRNIRNLAVIGLVFSIHWLTYFSSIKMATASIGLLGASTFGIHLIFLGWIFRKNRPSLFDGFAVMIAFIGTYLVIPEFSLANNITAGLLLGVISGFCFALLPILHQRNQHLPDSVRTFGQLFFAWIVFLFFIPVTEWHFKTADWLSLLYLAVLGTFIAHWLWVRVTTRMTTTTTSVIFYMVIPMTMALSYFWLGEEMGTKKIAGAFLIVAGNLISFFGRSRRNKFTSRESQI
ncbi:DMT family transporter [Bacteroidota bacterium]